MHAKATAVNADEAIAAMDSGQGKGFRVHYRPGDDPYFYLTLATCPPAEVKNRWVALWA